MAKKKTVDAEPEPVAVPGILLEDGSEIAFDPIWFAGERLPERCFRVRGSDQQWYDHTSDTPEGRWIYRHTDD